MSNSKNQSQKSDVEKEKVKAPLPTLKTEDEQGRIESKVPKRFVSTATQQSQTKEGINFDQVFEGVSPYKSQKRNPQQQAAMTLVYHENSQRIKLSKEVVEELGASVGNHLDIRIVNQSVIVRVHQEGIKLGKQNHLYSRQLIEDILEEFEYSNVQLATKESGLASSYHLKRHDVEQWEGETVIVIRK